jgi:hypothetical protein
MLEYINVARSHERKNFVDILYDIKRMPHLETTSSVTVCQ